MAVSKNKKNNIIIAKRTYTPTLYASGYTQIDTIGGIATALNKPELNNYTLIGMMIQGFADGNVYSLARGLSANAIYVIGKPSASVSFGVQYIFTSGDTESYS